MSENETRAPLSAHVGIFIQGCAVETPEGVALPALIGPMIESIAEAVDRVTVVAHDPPARGRTQDEIADYVARPARRNIGVLSTGPVGTWRDYIARRRRVRRIVSGASGAWDLAIVRLPNRRADTLLAGNRCSNVVSVVLGYAPGVARIVPAGPRKLIQQVNTFRTEITQRSILRASALAVFNSRDAADHYREEVPEPLMLPWSMRRERFAHLAPDRLVDGSANILLCARLTATKGVFEALDVFERIRADVLPHAHLDVVGDGDARGAMERLLQERGLEGYATFHGWVPAGPELFARFRDMDVMLHLSYAEGFPQVIWEALAHSVLVVCTPVGGLPHDLADGGEVLYVPVGDVEQVVTAVERLSTDGDLRRGLIRRGYERARASSVEVIVDDLVQHIAETWPELEVTTR
jgi:glycosyltransferase involved in cell wall biosynthesis